MVFIKDNFLDPSLCKGVINSSKIGEASKVIDKNNDKVLNEGYRNSKKLILSYPFQQALNDKLNNILPEVVAKLGGSANLEIEKIRGLKYEKGHFFKRHKDVGVEGKASRRKLTAIIFLNNEKKKKEIEAFSGGKLILYHLFSNMPNAGFPIDAVAGRLVIFPSRLPHEVTLIESGERYTIVAWYLNQLL